MYKDFKEFYWKKAIWSIGLPWGFTTGILVVIVQNKEAFRYFTNWATLLQIVFFILGGCILALTVGKSLWKRSIKSEAGNANDGEK
jgi:hypothetical protein